VMNVERGLYEAFKNGVALWGRQHQQAVDAAWHEALTNPSMARTISSALGLKQPTPMQLNKMHAYLITAGLHHPSNASEKSVRAIWLMIALPQPVESAGGGWHPKRPTWKGVWVGTG
jgi:hypothetical protein